MADHCGSLLYLGGVFILAAALYGQAPVPSSEFIAFRVDSERVVAGIP